MGTHIMSYCLEGNSSTRHPLFNGSSYNKWKTRMTIYLQSLDVVVHGSHTPTNQNDNGEAFEKPNSE